LSGGEPRHGRSHKIRTWRRRMSVENCPTCKLLFDEFSESTRAHFAILSKRQKAQIEHNSPLIEELEPLKLAAQERRGKARQELRRHEATHDNGAKP
jgi:hypothetical protein